MRKQESANCGEIECSPNPQSPNHKSNNQTPNLQLDARVREELKRHVSSERWKQLSGGQHVVFNQKSAKCCGCVPVALWGVGR